MSEPTGGKAVRILIGSGASSLFFERSEAIAEWASTGMCPEHLSRLPSDKWVLWRLILAPSGEVAEGKQINVAEALDWLLRNNGTIPVDLQEAVEDRHL